MVSVSAVQALLVIVISVYDYFLAFDEHATTVVEVVAYGVSAVEEVLLIGHRAGRHIGNGSLEVRTALVLALLGVFRSRIWHRSTIVKAFEGLVFMKDRSVWFVCPATGRLRQGVQHPWVAVCGTGHPCCRDGVRPLRSRTPSCKA